MADLPTYDLDTRTVTDPDGTTRPFNPDEVTQFGLDAAPASQPLMVDPATVTALVTQAQAATTIEQVKDALLATFAAIAGQASPPT